MKIHLCFVSSLRCELSVVSSQSEIAVSRAAPGLAGFIAGVRE